MELKGTMRANKGFKVKKTVHVQSTKVINHSITNCKVCMFTCHPHCRQLTDQKQKCHVMRDGRCVVCPGHCPWESHTNGDRSV